MADTFTTLWNRLRLRAPAVDAALSQDLIRDAFQQLAERREWSWLMKHSAFYPPTYNISDTVSVVSNYNLVTSAGGAFTPAMAGIQIRIGGSNYPTYTIAQYLTPTTVLLDTPWIGPTASGLQYSVFQCFFPVPADFNYFYSLINISANTRLHTNLTQAELDLCDPQRVQSGLSLAAAFYDYTSIYSGSIPQPLQILGTGPSPVTTTATGLTFPANTTFSIQITTGGSIGTAQFVWKQDGGNWSPPILSTAYPQNLASGVQLYFPANTYILNDLFVINCLALATLGQARYELWPRPINAPYAYGYQYVSKLPALSDSNPQLPPFISQRGDVLLEMALAASARYPGTDTARNAYYDLNLARQHDTRAEYMINELEVKDDDTAAKNLTYEQMAYYPAPWLDGSWLQSHGPIYSN